MPPSKDLREAWWKVGDQGSTGSCVGWGRADGVLRWRFVQAGRIKTTELLAPRFVWMAAKETDPDSHAADDVHRERGHEPQGGARRRPEVRRRAGQVLPFATGALYQDDGKTFYATAAQLKISSYFNLGTSLDAWRTWLAGKGPILTRLGVDATWDDADLTGRAPSTCTSPTPSAAATAVALVGYTTDRFVVRNSWGTLWGDKGFGYASLGYAQTAFTEAYGIQV